jgi:hypothetical protein
MATLVLKQGDNYKTFWRIPELTLLPGDVTHLWAQPISAGESVELSTTIEDGEAVHMWSGGLDVGEYNVELEVIRGEQKITAPTDGYWRLKIITDLG